MLVLEQEPSFTFTEEYQVEFMAEYQKTFDKYRSQFLVGEMVWNFADFMTVQGKGCFVRLFIHSLFGEDEDAFCHEENIDLPGF